jgi:hypothetical protein
MFLQNKLYPCFDRDFWKDLTRSISFLIRDLIAGRDIARLARLLKEAGVKCSDSLLYRWANPQDVDALPSLRALLLLIKITENCSAIDSINEACGKIGVPDDDFLAGVKAFTVEFEKRQAMRGPAPAAAHHPHNPLGDR